MNSTSVCETRNDDSINSQNFNYQIPPNLTYIKPLVPTPKLKILSPARTSIILNSPPRNRMIEETQPTIKDFSEKLKVSERCMINCEYQMSDKCKKRVDVLVGGAKDNIKRNGKYMCNYCSIFIRSEKNIEKNTEEKKKYIDSSKLENILAERKNKPLSGKTKTCPLYNHDCCSRNCIPRYPYNKDSVPIEDFYNESNPSQPFEYCLGCRTYRAQCLEINNAKKEASSNIPDCKTCMSGCHLTASTMPRENIPIKYFLKNPEDPNSKICKNCSDCRKHIKNGEDKRITKFIENGDIFCNDCKVKKTPEEMAENLDGTMTKCKICKKRDVDHWAKRYNRLMEHFRKLQFDRIIEKECSCEVCKCIFIKPNEGEFICTKLETRYENGKNVVNYEGKTYTVAEFLSEYKDLLEYRILDFDHLPTDNPSMKKLYEVSRAKEEEYMTNESLKCQLVDCECHLKETINREKGGNQIYGEISKKREYVNNIKREGCSFCHYVAENDDMLRFIHMDHIDPSNKITELSNMIRDSEYSMKDLYEESPKCRPLCAFCHRILTNYFFRSSYIESYNSIELGPVEFDFNQI